MKFIARSHSDTCFQARSEKSNLLALSTILLTIAVSASLIADDSQVQTILARLESAEFSERVQARRELHSVASEHLKLLEEAAIQSAPETASHVIDVLKSLFLQNDGPLGDQVEQILQRIAYSGGTGSVQAGQVLQGNAYLRESRARAALEPLGAQFVYFAPLAESNGQAIFETQAAVLPDVGVGFGPSAMLHSIYLHDDWKGTPQDLWHFTRLASHRDLAIYSIKGNNIDPNQLFVLARFLRGLTIQERGACLGIRSSPFTTTCVVGAVVEGGAAHKGGLQEGDLIELLDATPIRTFPHLVQTLQSYNIGDKVTFTILRDNEQLTKEVTLSSWRDVAMNDELSVPTPPPFGGPFGKAQAAPEPPQGSDSPAPMNDPAPSQTE